MCGWAFNLPKGNRALGNKFVFCHYNKTNLKEYSIKPLRIEFTLIIKPKQSYRHAKTIKTLIKILDLRTCQDE
jgi:transcriptional regulator of nitric oxide reductase